MPHRPSCAATSLYKLSVNQFPGSCWAFSAVAAMEGITQLTTGKLISLSEQELVDCNTRGEIKAVKGVPRKAPSNSSKTITASQPKPATPTRPVSVSIDTERSDFQFYSIGVFTGAYGTSLDHDVTAVGYGVSNDRTKYWLVKNSWGTQWGEERYIRMQRDVAAQEGLCGIAMQASYPTA
nr:senescence-specific cysteine protease sag39 [Quercus suber]